MASGVNRGAGPEDDDLLMEMLAAARPKTSVDPVTSPQAVALFERITSESPGPERRSGAARRVLRARWRGIPLAVSGFAAVAAAVIITVVLLPSGSGPGGLRAGTVVTGAELTARMTSAAAAVAGDVVEVKSTEGPYVTTTWWSWNTIPEHTVYQVGGRTCFTETETATQVTVVDYATRTWWTRSVPKNDFLVPEIIGCRFDGFTTQAGMVGFSGEGSWTKQGIQQGEYTVDGPAVVDGQAAIHLTQGTGSGIISQEWVSAATYLPLRTATVVPSMHITEQSTISYLTPSRANRALVGAAVPAGFRKVRS